MEIEKFEIFKLDEKARGCRIIDKDLYYNERKKQLLVDILTTYLLLGFMVSMGFLAGWICSANNIHQLTLTEQLISGLINK